MGREKYESYKSGIRGEKEEPIVAPRPANRIAGKLVIGEKYTLRIRTRGHIVINDEAPAKEITAKLVGLYRHVAVFEYRFGYQESFTYWELERVMR